MGERLKFSVISAELRKICTEMESVVLQTVAHRKKFQLAISQFSSFVDSLNQIPPDTILEPLQIESYRLIVDITREYQQIFGQHLLHCWAHSALDSNSAAVPSELTNLTSKLNEHASILHSPGAKFFDSTANQWLQYHILDLKAISASFNQYLSSPKDGDPVVPIMTERLESISNFLQEYSSDSVIMGVSVFSPIPIHYQSWKIDQQDIKEIKEIGSGVSAIVYYGTDLRTGQEVAVKKLKFKKLSGAKLRAFQREVVILATASHPALLRFVGATDSPPFCIVTEWMAGGNLYNEIHKRKRLDQSQITCAAYDIARGMRFLHSRQIVHRDLKSLNVLLDNNGRAKICDFGFSRHADKNDVMTQNVGTPHWMAPELLSASTCYDSRIDVYAYGIVLWEMLVKKLPYTGLEAPQIVAQVLMNDLRPAIPKTADPELERLISDCWDRDPHNRPTFDEIIKRFKSGKILFPGADARKVSEYILSETDETDIALEEIESQLESAPCPESLYAFVEALEKEALPSDLIERCWNNLHELDHSDQTETFARGLATFLDTPLVANAAKELRCLDPGSIPPEVAAKAVSRVPTGREETDNDLIIIACKNGAASHAALHALQPIHIKLAFEMISRIGLPEENFEPVIKRCIQCLSSPDSMLVVASLRCILSSSDAQMISINDIKPHMQSRNPTLNKAAYIAVSRMALDGIKIPIDIIDTLASKWDSESVSCAIVVAACKNSVVAHHMISRIAYGSTPPLEIAVKILIQCAEHEELKKDVKGTLNRLKIETARPDIQRAAKVLLTKLESSLPKR